MMPNTGTSQLQDLVAKIKLHSQDHCVKPWQRSASRAWLIHLDALGRHRPALEVGQLLGAALLDHDLAACGQAGVQGGGGRGHEERDPAGHKLEDLGSKSLITILDRDLAACGQAGVWGGGGRCHKDRDPAHRHRLEDPQMRSSMMRIHDREPDHDPGPQSGRLWPGWGPGWWWARPQRTGSCRAQALLRLFSMSCCHAEVQGGAPKNGILHTP